MSYENNSKFIKNVCCPKCRERGEDRNGDNLATYSDGSSYCWKCNHYTLSDNVIFNFLHRSARNVSKPLPKIVLPSDASVDYPDKAVAFITKYDLSRIDLLNNGVLWTDKGVSINIKGEKIAANELLIFPFWFDGELLGWQGRYFGIDKRIPKWISRGDMQKICHFLFLGKVGHDENDEKRVVLVEDVLSAIKVSKAGFCSMPLFGVSLKPRWPQIRVLNYRHAVIFLDPDQHLHSIKEALVGRLNGISIKTILSQHDPKEYTIDEIKELINGT